MQKNYLLTPGPTPVPESALLAMAQPIIHHRTPQFQMILKEVEENLKYVFQTKENVYIFASSGTGAMEAAVANLLSPAEKAVVVRGGKFGERFGEICKAYNICFIPIDTPSGQTVSAEKIKEVLDKNPDVKAVFTTLVETSTGVTNDIKAIANVVNSTNAVLVVDAISGLCSVPLYMDEWRVDVVVAGSQKGLMVPPGLSFIALGPKAWRMVETSQSSRYYFDLRKAKEAMDKTDTPFTPAINLIIGLAQALRIIKSERIENIWKRHKRMADAVRAAVQSMGLEMFPHERASDAVTAVKVPNDIDGEKLVKILRDTYGVGIAGGQEELRGKIFRIATMGYMTEWDVCVALSALEIVLIKMGYNIEPGEGLKAAQKVFLS
jgi:aspartate aminotransferase-like enzyme